MDRNESTRERAESEKREDMFLQYELPKRLAKAVDIQKRLACASTEELLEKRRQMNEKIIFRSSGMRLLISAGWM